MCTPDLQIFTKNPSFYSKTTENGQKSFQIELSWANFDYFGCFAFTGTIEGMK